MSKAIIELLNDQLQSANTDNLIWKLEDQKLYCQYTQFIEQNDDKMSKYVLQDGRDILYEKQQKHEEVLISKPCISKTEPCKIETLFKDKKSNKKDIIKPIELILRETNTLPINQDHIKSRLIEFISKNEFIKVFGAKKSAEVMSAIVNNRWNKSAALFMSFIFDKTVQYNKDVIIYNKEKNNGTILLDAGLKQW